MCDDGERSKNWCENDNRGKVPSWCHDSAAARASTTQVTRCDSCDLVPCGQCQEDCAPTICDGGDSKNWCSNDNKGHFPTSCLETTTLPPAPAPPPPQAGIAVVDFSKPTSLFCWSMVLTDGVEQWLITIQWHRGTGIFGCHHAELLSDGNLTLNSWTQAPLKAVSLPGPKAWFGPVKNTPQGVWHNTNVFVRAWNWIAEQKTYMSFDWTVKVDPDCAFMPGILQAQLSARYFDIDVPMYLLNCEQWMAIQGPLEIFSKAGARQFFDSLSECQSWIDWEKWGEDWFVGKCMKALGVQQQEGFETLNDMWCKDEWSHSGHDYEDEVAMNGVRCDDGKAAFHPYKTTEDMKQCIEQAMSVTRIAERPFNWIAAPTPRPS